MKQVLLCFLVLFLFSCSKESTLPGPQGTWTIIETSAGTGYGFIHTNYQPGTGTDIHFGANGHFEVSDPASQLSAFNRFEVNGNQIRFYNNSTQEEMKASFEINTKLSLSYELARCGYIETFIPR